MAVSISAWRSALEEGLVVPAIRNAGELSMLELHEQSKALAAKARATANCCRTK